MKQHLFLGLFLLAINGYGQKTQEARGFTRAKLTQVKLLSELSSELPKDMTKATVEMVCKVKNQVKLHGFTGDTLSAGVRSALKEADHRSTIYFDVKSAGPKPNVYAFAILVQD